MNAGDGDECKHCTSNIDQFKVVMSILFLQQEWAKACQSDI